LLGASHTRLADDIDDSVWQAVVDEYIAKVKSTDRWQGENIQHRRTSFDLGKR
jgi:hypothetical protein